MTVLGFTPHHSEMTQSPLINNNDTTYKSDRERQISYDVTYMWNLKNSVNERIYETETDSQT